MIRILAYTIPVLGIVGGVEGIASAVSRGGVDPTKRHMGGWEGALSSGGGFNFMFYLIPAIERGYPNLLVWMFFGFGGPQNTKMGQAGGPAGPAAHTNTAFENKLNASTKQLFGVELQSFTRSRDGHNGSFTGYGADAYGAGGSDTQITVVNEVNSYTSESVGGNGWVDPATEFACNGTHRFDAFRVHSIPQFYRLRPNKLTGYSCNASP